MACGRKSLAPFSQSKRSYSFHLKKVKKLMENSLLTKVDIKACQKRIVLLLCKLLIQLNRCGAITIILSQSARMKIDANIHNYQYDRIG